MDSNPFWTMYHKLGESMNGIADCYNMSADGMEIHQAHQIGNRLDSMAKKTQNNMRYLATQARIHDDRLDNLTYSKSDATIKNVLQG